MNKNLENNDHETQDQQYEVQNQNTDASYALQIQMEEEQYEIERQKKVSEQAIEDYKKALQIYQEEEEMLEQRRIEESYDECGCCCCQQPFIEMAQCPEGHLVCKRCIITSIETALSEGRVLTQCPNISCNSHLTNSELERILPANLMRRFDETEAMNALSTIKIPYLRTCWKCGLKVIDESERNPFACPQCSQKTCKLCGKKYHPNRSCEEAEIDPNRLVENRMSEAIVKSCPNCKTQYIKDEGCNHMTCPRCKTEFCYLCGKVIPPGQLSNHYRSCQQYINNSEYNQQQIQKARQKAIIDFNIQ